MPTPGILYKYIDPVGGIALLRNRCLRWSTPQRFNDPADMQIDYEVRLDANVVAERALAQLWERCVGDCGPPGNQVAALIDLARDYWLSLGRDGFYSAMRPGINDAVLKMPDKLVEFSAAMRHALSLMKVISFTEVRDNNLMWSHYADKHTGIVLGFRDLPELDSPYHMAQAMTYSDRPPELATSEEFADIVSGLGKLTTDMVYRMVFTKSAEWSYEREWRIQTGDGRQPEASYEDIPFAAAELAEVILGCKCPAGVREEISDLTRNGYPSARLWQAERATHSYRLTFTEVPTVVR